MRYDKPLTVECKQRKFGCIYLIRDAFNKVVKVMEDPQEAAEFIEKEKER